MNDNLSVDELLTGYQDGTEGLTAPELDVTRLPDAPQQVQQEPEGTTEPEQQEGRDIGLVGDLLINAKDFIDNRFQGDQTSREQMVDDYATARDEREGARASNPLSAAADEITAVGAQGGARLIEGVGETGELLGDLGKSVLGIAEEGDNVFEGDTYRSAEWDLGIADTKTAVGNFTAEALAIVVGMGAAGAAGVSVGKGATAGSRLLTEASRGALVDLIINPGEGNLSNALEEVSPGLKDSWVTALAHEDDDNPFIRRIKNVIEGGLIGSAVDGVGELYGAIRAGRKAIKAGKSVDEAVELAAKSVDTPRPGAEIRAAEEAANGASPNKAALYEPNERAAKSSEFNPQDAAKSQFEAEAFDGVFPVGANPVLTDAAYQKIVGPRANQLATGKAATALDEIIQDTASKIDVEQLSRDLGQSWEETTSKALITVRNFLTDNTGDNADIVNLFKAGESTDWTALKSLSTEGDITLPFYATREGVVATKTLLRDTAMQIDEIGQAAGDVIRSSGDVTRQSEMLFDRLQGLLRMHKQASIHYGSGLNSFRIGAITVGNSQAALSKQMEGLEGAITEMRRLVQLGDPESMLDFRRLVNGLVMAGGDPSKQVGFWAMARKIGFRDALTAMYNSMLSGPLTQTRNIIGGLTTTTLRPLSVSMGYVMQGDTQRATANLVGSFHSFSDSVSEAFSVLGDSFKAGIPVNEGSKFISYSSEVAKDIQLLKASVEPGDVNGQAFVKFIEWQHSMINSPFLTLPTRTMTAVDDAFKTLNARMELKREVFMESVDVGGGFTFNADEYAKRATQKFAANGEIIDGKLLGVAKEQTFQQDLAGQMASFKHLTDSNPVAKYFFPFVKTPWNIIVYGASHVPGANRFLSEYKTVMAGTDEVAKAMYKGREGLGWMTITAGLGLGLTGQITGNPLVTGAGDVDPDTRKLDSTPPYSFRILGTDTWVSYQNIEGLAPILGAIADLSKVAHKLSYGDFQAASAQLAYSIAAVTTDKSYFQGLTNAVNLLESVRKGQGGRLTTTFAELGNNLVPYSGARRQLGKALSTHLYDHKDFLSRTLASASANLIDFGQAPRIDVFSGKPIDNPSSGGSLLGLLNNFLPFNVQDVDTDPVKKKLSEVGFDVNVEFGETLKGVQMTPAQKQELNRLIAEKGLRADLKRVMDYKWWNEDYQNWVAAKRRGAAIQKEDTRWWGALQDAYDLNERAAIATFRREDPTFNEDYTAARTDSRRGKAGIYSDSVEKLINYGKQ